MFTAYAIINEFSKVYIGHTENLNNRLDRHNRKLPTKKKSFTYKNGSVWKLLHKEDFSTRKDAMKREKELKSYKGREFLKSLIKKD